MNTKLEHLKNLFKSSDEKTLDDFNVALASVPLSSEQRGMCESLQKNSAEYLRDLVGENGSPRLVKTEKGMLAVIKTYAPSVDVRSQSVIQHKDRLDLLREEQAAFFVATHFPLVNVPVTVLRPLSQNQAREWRIPQVYSSDSPDNPSVPEVVLLQQFIEDAQTYAAIHKPLQEIATPSDIFGLLIFDYLIAYGDGRFRNLLVKGDTLWAIDHGGSFRYRGSIRGTDTMDIHDNLQLDENGMEKLRVALNPERIASAVGVLVRILDKKKSVGFIERLAKVNKLLAGKKLLSIKELKEGVT